MLICESWTKNWEEYFKEASLEGHIENHPMKKECVINFIEKRLGKLELIEGLKGSRGYLILDGSPGEEFSNYLIKIEKNLSNEKQAEIFMHEITHGHYLNVINVTKYQESLITKHAKQFFEDNRKFSIRKYQEVSNPSQLKIPF